MSVTSHVQPQLFYAYPLSHSHSAEEVDQRHLFLYGYCMFPFIVWKHAGKWIGVLMGNIP